MKEGRGGRQAKVEIKDVKEGGERGGVVKGEGGVGKRRRRRRRGRKRSGRKSFRPRVLRERARERERKKR